MATYYITGNLTSGSPTVTNVSSLAGLATGQVIASPGIPLGAVTIIALGVNSFTLSTNANSTIVGANLVAQDVVNMTNLQIALQNAILMLSILMIYPKPSYSIDGQSVSWEGYYGMVLRAIPEIRAQIQVEGGPFMYRTQLFS